MTFVHDDSAFDELIRIVADKRRVAVALVEKDYWVTHALWALHQTGLEVWFKGGTSLSKGFGLIERFSEDLDLKMDVGTVASLPRVSSWTSDGAAATQTRKTFFETLATVVAVPGARVELNLASADARWRSSDLLVHYPGKHLSALGVLTPFVRLEVGSARVTPFVERDMTSFVHDELVAQRSLHDFDDNRPKAVRCVHPIVTLLEKLDAICRRFPNEKVPAAAFVRHFEDAARIVSAHSALPDLGYESVRALADEMCAKKDLRALPASRDLALVPGEAQRWREIRGAYAAIGPMFWGARTSLESACESIRVWIDEHLSK